MKWFLLEMKYQKLCISQETGTFLGEADLHKNGKKNEIINQECLNLQILNVSF